jgi:hypothetical protein
MIRFLRGTATRRRRFTGEWPDYIDRWGLCLELDGNIFDMDWMYMFSMIDNDMLVICPSFLCAYMIILLIMAVLSALLDLFDDFYDLNRISEADLLLRYDLNL